MTDSTDNAQGPERICTWPSCGCTARGQCQGLGLRHVRADLAPDPLTDPRVKALVEAAQLAIHHGVIWRNETEREFQTTMRCYEALVAALAAFDTTTGGKDE
jgi:hypothetical protein